MTVFPCKFSHYKKKLFLSRQIRPSKHNHCDYDNKTKVSGTSFNLLNNGEIMVELSLEDQTLFSLCNTTVSSVLIILFCKNGNQGLPHNNKASNKHNTVKTAFSRRIYFLFRIKVLDLSVLVEKLS